MGSTVSATVELLEGMAFAGTTDSQHRIILDAAPSVGGTNRGPRPMELLLLGLGGCTGIDVISILRKQRQDVTGYQIQLRAERSEETPHVFTTIVVEHVIHGRQLNVASIHRAIELSATRYCSAAAMLGAVARITDRFRVIDDETGAETVGSVS